MAGALRDSQLRLALSDELALRTLTRTAQLIRSEVRTLEEVLVNSLPVGLWNEHCCKEKESWSASSELARAREEGAHREVGFVVFRSSTFSGSRSCWVRLTKKTGFFVKQFKWSRMRQ